MTEDKECFDMTEDIKYFGLTQDMTCFDVTGADSSLHLYEGCLVCVSCLKQ